MAVSANDRRWLALWFPWLPCERAKRDNAPPEDPFALVARAGNALRLTAVDRESILTPGMTLTDACARCPDLVTQPDDPVADAQALTRLAGRMLRFTPLVTPDPPDGLLLDITGCAHLFGGEGALVAQIIAAAGFTTRHALAGRSAAARALVRYGGEDVRALPVAALELPENALSGLRRAGLVTLGDCARRPASALAARFGAEAVRALRAILGEEASPRAPIQPTAPIRAEARFAEPLTRSEAALATIENLLGETTRQMEARKLGGRRFVATLDRSDGIRQRLAVETGLPTRDPAVVMRLFHERIESLADPLDPGFGFDSIALAVPQTEPLGARQIALEGGASEEDTVERLIDRLTTRLGPERVRRLVPRDSHIPEAAQYLAPAIASASARWPPSSALPRPPFLFDPPQAIIAIAGVPDGPPRQFRWRGALHEVVLAEGPERIAAEWWRKQAPTRDYYRVEDSEGRRFWLFRHGLFEESGQPRWYLHGLFA